MFAKRKMAGTGIEDNVSAACGQAASGPRSYPSVFADFKSDPDPANIKDQISNRILNVIDFNRGCDFCRPCFKPTCFVMDAVAGEVLFGDESNQAAVNDQRRDVKDSTGVQ